MTRAKLADIVAAVVLGLAGAWLLVWGLSN